MKDSIKIQNQDGFQIPLLIQSYKRLKKESLLSILSVNEHFTNKLVESISKENNLFMHLDRSLPMIYQPAVFNNLPEMGGLRVRRVLPKTY